MSPALDATVTLPAWPSDGIIFKDVAETENVGGKGINVARWLALRGAQVACGGLLGADNAAPFEQELARCGIGDAFVRVPGATRRNEMIVTPGGSFKLNRPAFPGLAADFDVLEVIKDFKDVEDSSRVAILSGSLPPAVSKDFYAAATRALKARGWTVALDASGEALRLGVAAGPDLIKPNADECEALVGFVPKTPDEFRRATEMLREQAAHVIISDGGAGAWFDGVFTPAPAVKVLDTTSAGDTLLAEYCWRHFGGATDASKWAVAAGSAAVTMPGSMPPPIGLVEQLKENIR
jgi:1-phosphofructokinase